jgi:GDP-L-fucose synthase
MNAANSKKIFVAGHNGMVGSAIMRGLRRMGEVNIVTRTREELDLVNQMAVADFFDKERPDEVYIAAAKVGGIFANSSYPADFIYQNIMIEANIIHQAFIHGVKKVLFLGSSCIYPKYATQPMSENALLTGKLEPSNEPYAIAKIAGIKLCESYNRQYSATYGTDYRSVMPTNLYGPGDNYHPQNSHVIPGMIRRFHEAVRDKNNEVVIWGTGKVRREFLFVDDMAEASIFVMNLEDSLYRNAVKDMESHINVGCGVDVTILELAEIIKKTVGYEGQILFDTEKPDGAPQKLMNSCKLTNLGWIPKVSLEEGIKLAYDNFLSNESTRSK